MKAKITCFVAVLFTTLSVAQTKSVLFIGNSYTGFNNLPQLTKDVALSAGDTLEFDAHTPGGAQLSQHASSATAIQKIYSRNWDHVVLQAQSQEPSFSQTQVQQMVYPYAKILCDTIRANDSCTRPIFYRTWGRKNGDASNCGVAPWVCTYEGMDSALAYSYGKMADDNDAFLSPVGDVWKYIRTNYPSIDLYNPDESHPSLAGSYAAACTFYTIVFQKDPTLITHNASLSAADAQNIRNATKLVVYDSLSSWNVGKFKPLACFTYYVQGCTVTFDGSCSLKSSSYSWDSDDGITSPLNGLIIAHTYAIGGAYDVTLTVSQCGQTDDTTITVYPCQIGLEENSLSKQNLIYPNPAFEVLNIQKHENAVLTEISITDLNGKVFAYFKTSLPDRVDISSWPRGSYLIKFTSKSGESYTQTFVKE